MLTAISSPDCKDGARSSPLPSSTILFSHEDAKRISENTIQQGASNCGDVAVNQAIESIRLMSGGAHDDTTSHPSLSPGEEPSVSSTPPVSLSPASFSQSVVSIRLRKHDAPLGEYLLSRSLAGCTHREIIEGMEKATHGAVVSHFFPGLPVDGGNRSGTDGEVHQLHLPLDRRRIRSWMCKWMSRGAVPVATMNLQQLSLRYDAWHHEMIYGVSDEGIHMLNPLSIMPMEDFWKVICSPSLLRVRVLDVVARIVPQDPLDLDHIRGPEWEKEGVIEQIRSLAQLLFSSRHNSNTGDSGMEGDGAGDVHHITIPASYQSGVTLFALRDSLAGRDLLEIERQ